MTLWQALWLGIVQGLSEFLPISSSGHLALFSSLFGLEHQSLLFEVALHVATMAAVVGYFWQSLVTISWAKIKLLIIATLPIVLFGLLVESILPSFFNSLLFIGVCLLITGLVNFMTDRRLLVVGDADQPMTATQALKVGGYQAVALLPGISRSALTVAGGVAQGWTRQQSFEFAFLMSIPAILGATVLQLVELTNTGGLFELSWLVVVVGMGAAFITGWLSLRLLQFILTKARSEWFAYYCWLVGGLSIFVALSQSFL